MPDWLAELVRPNPAPWPAYLELPDDETLEPITEAVRVLAQR